MHLGGNRRQVPLKNEALSIIIYVKKLSRYAMLRRIKRCKRVLYLVLHRTKKTRICKLKTLQNTRLRCEKHRGKRVSVSGYILVSPFFHVSVAAFITDETITIIQQYYRIYFVFCRSHRSLFILFKRQRFFNQILSLRSLRQNFFFLDSYQKRVPFIIIYGSFLQRKFIQLIDNTPCVLLRTLKACCAFSHGAFV